ncbi:MAG: serine/threonine protein kinase [Candidatus Promineifilaceae bacterium]
MSNQSKIRKHQFGAYTIEGAIAQSGGMSTIYRAYVTAHPDRKVALKLPNVGGEYVDIVHTEASFLRRMHHPGIVQIYPILGFDKPTYVARTNHSTKGRWYYVMEHISGGNLEQQLTKLNRFSIEWKFELFYQITCILHYMHMAGYAHCDLKPSNIMFRRPIKASECPEPVLIDFGSVSRRDQVQEKIGTPRYTPPEMFRAMQKKNNPTAHRGIRGDKIDIWQLGIIFYELITGDSMFQGTSLEIETTVLNHVIKRIQDSPIKLANDRLDIFLKSMLHRKPNFRLNAEDIIEVIQEVIPEYRAPRVATLI